MRPGLFPGLNGSPGVVMERNGAEKERIAHDFFSRAIDPFTQAYLRDGHYDSMHQKAAAGAPASVGANKDSNLSLRKELTRGVVTSGEAAEKKISPLEKAKAAPDYQQNLEQQMEQQRDKKRPWLMNPFSSKYAAGITMSPRLTHNLSDRLKATSDRIQGGGSRVSHITAPPPAMGAATAAPKTGLPETPGGIGEDGVQTEQPKNVQVPTTTQPVMDKAAGTLNPWWTQVPA